MRVITYIGAISILYVLYKYISDATRRRDPRRTEALHPPDAASPSSSNPQNYDVFLSFRGETWKTFTSHLYKALEQKGIYTFLDVKRLERGEDISPGLDKTIEGSRCAVVVVSGNYASSRWCMDELVQILQCRKDSKIQQIVLPVFYHVNPDDTLKERGTIWEGFQRLKEEFSNNEEKVKSWRDALIQLTCIAGYHVHHGTNEAIFIEYFIEEVSSRLFDDLVGMDSRLWKLEQCVSRSSSRDVRDVRFIGIYGMGGLGKTTLARAYFRYMSRQFEASSFLANIREACENKHDGLVMLQKQLLTDVLKGEHMIYNVFHGKDMIRSRLCGKKVLVVLDDVDQLDQLEGLAEKKNWFGDGSQIIVTTRDESLLPHMYGEKEYIIHKVDELEYNEALLLFSLKAFKGNCPPEDYRALSTEVIKYASGLPLALIVLGSLLQGKHIDQWKSALNRLKEYPEKNIIKALKISFDGLEKTEKNIFLDIACFFNGSSVDYVMNVMGSCGFFPEISIRSLVDKSLLHIDRDTLRMHNFLEEMGKEIVREESRYEPGRRSRIWLDDDLYRVLKKETGTEAVEAIVCPRMKLDKIFTLRGFSNMKNLRLLIIHSIDFMSFERDRCPDNEYLPNELLFLEWGEFPLKSFPRSFQPHGLVELILTDSKVIERLWDNPMMEPLSNLKSIVLSGSQQIKKLENFSLFPNLEKLNLSKCGLRDGAFPDDFGCLDSLEYLDLSLNEFSCLPAHFNQLSKLRHLDLSFCRNLKSLGAELPDSLEWIDVEYCGELHTFLKPLSQCNLQCSTIYCVGCFKLVNKQGSQRTAMTSLGRYLQNPPKPSKRFDIVLPGNEIPSWFTHKVRGSSSTSLPLNPNWCTNEWMGFALSVCFADTGGVIYVRSWSWEIKINEEDWGFGHVHWPVKYVDGTNFGDGHIWLLYLPRDTYFHSEWHKKSGNIQFSFKPTSEFERLEFKECGVRLMYEQDMEELNLTARDEPTELAAKNEDEG